MKKLTLWLSMTGILALAAFDQRGSSAEHGDGVLTGARDRADTLRDANEQAGDVAQNDEPRPDDAERKASDTRS
jgi:hypothetical protein